MSDYARMERALRYLHDHALDQPSLGAIAGEVGLSAYHFQRSFRRWVGVSPKRYLQHLTAAGAKAALRQNASVLSATYDVGLSGPSRLHDLFVALEAVTPGQYKARGQALVLRYGVHWTPLGPAVIALTERGICGLHFLARPSWAEAAGLLGGEWPQAELRRDPDTTAAIVYRIFHRRRWSLQDPFHLHLTGTNFQIQVWRALLQIPVGETMSYADLSRAAGQPASSARAVAGGVAHNPVAFLIPCHRVIRTSGALGGYRWGAERKQQLLALEQPS